MKIHVGFRNGIGNFILLTPALQALAKHSGSTVNLVLDEQWQDGGRESIELMARDLPFVDKVFNYPSEYTIDKNFYISKHNIIIDPLYMEVHGSPFVKPPSVPTWRETRFHERDFYYFEIMKQFGYRGSIFPQVVEKKFWPWIVDGPKICIANGWLRNNSGKWRHKAYPRFQEVIEGILGLYPRLSIILLGDKSDHEDWEKILAEQPSFWEERVFNLAGDTNILQTASIIDQCDFIITNDTGIMHIADAFYKPGIVLFGPTLISKNGPLNGTLQILRSPHFCAPCQYKIDSILCNDYGLCMGKISPGQILVEFRKHFRID